MGLIQRAKNIAYALFATFGKQPKEALARHHRQTTQLRNAEFSLTIAQVRRLIAAAQTPRDKLIIRLFAETGIRRSELIDLRWEDIDFASKLLVVRNGKGSKMRVIPITADTAQILILGHAPNATGYVFTSRQSAKLSARQVNRIMNRTGEAAGVRHPNPRYRHLTCHVFRHTFARQWKAHGGSIETLSALMGHESQQVTLDVYGREGFVDMQRNYETIMRAQYHARGQMKNK